LFRVHEGPGLDKLVDLKTFLKEFNLTLKGGDEPEPKHYAELLKQIDGRAEKQLIQMVLLRSLSQAIYTPDNAGHFGLAYDSYTHFTSPIRRYPDLLVHRAIKTMLNGKVKQYPYEKTDMEKLGSHCSMTERRADDATRDIIDWLKCYYMRDHVGSEHAGFIVGVTGFGLFIQLKDIYIEGLLHITALKNDYYHFDAIHHTLSGERSNVTYRIGDVLNVQVARVSLDNREIDLTLA
ncbi:MAG: RNB domain-containing ribonuclease, partial [Pseudomonadota bacterium]